MAAFWACTANPIYPTLLATRKKTYFTPGDTGFKAWQTRYGVIGVAICWDQWFPEAAPCMALQGAELLLYPTAIGSEPGVAELDSRDLTLYTPGIGA